MTSHGSMLNPLQLVKDNGLAAKHESLSGALSAEEQFAQSRSAVAYSTGGDGQGKETTPETKEIFHNQQGPREGRKREIKPLTQ